VPEAPREQLGWPGCDQVPVIVAPPETATVIDPVNEYTAAPQASVADMATAPAVEADPDNGIEPWTSAWSGVINVPVMTLLATVAASRNEDPPVLPSRFTWVPVAPPV